MKYFYLFLLTLSAVGVGLNTYFDSPGWALFHLVFLVFWSYMLYVSPDDSAEAWRRARTHRDLL